MDFICNKIGTHGFGLGHKGEACRILFDLFEAYALYASKKQFQNELEKFRVGHLRPKALVQRLVKAGLWKE